MSEPQFEDIPVIKRIGSRIGQYSTPFHQAQKMAGINNFEQLKNFNLNRNSDLSNN